MAKHTMGFLIRSCFWLGLTFHAMSWGDARLADFVPTPAQAVAVGLAAQNGDGGAASTIARAVLRGALDAQLTGDAGITARSEPSKSRRASIDSLSAADRLPVWRGAPLRGTL